MMPYIKSKARGSGKFTPDLGRGTGISKLGKAVAKNANRSRRKGARQEFKQHILIDVLND